MDCNFTKGGRKSGSDHLIALCIGSIFDIYIHTGKSKTGFVVLFRDCFPGFSAAITEMLVQSHEGEIVLLPALPKEWNNGSISGVCVRGGFELDYTWKHGKVEAVKIKSNAGSTCRIRTGSKLIPYCNGKEVLYNLNEDGSIAFKTEKGIKYILRE